jgi:hypothetical protein
MAGSSTEKLVSGLVAGIALGVGLALFASSRSAEAGSPIARLAARSKAGPTPFEPANLAIERARSFVIEVRTQVRLAVEEGRATAAQTRADLTARFEAAKHAPSADNKSLDQPR